MPSKIPVGLCIMAAIWILPDRAASFKDRGNYPYVKSDLGGVFYVRCIPAGRKDARGTTTVYRVDKAKDVVTDTYGWYTRRGIALGWSPKAGKVAVARTHSGQKKKANLARQVDLSFYLAGKKLSSYTTRKLLSMGAELSRDIRAKFTGLKRARVELLGAVQVPGTNDYRFEVRVSDTKVLRFDILTGKPVAR